MDANTYQHAVERTAKREPRRITESEARLLNFALGMAGEAGEAADLIKKHVFHEHALDHDLLVKEIGDVVWYCAAMASELGVSFSSVLEANVEKLQMRYPEGFDVARSRERPEEMNWPEEWVHPPTQDEFFLFYPSEIFGPVVGTVEFRKVTRPMGSPEGRRLMSIFCGMK